MALIPIEDFVRGTVEFALKELVPQIVGREKFNVYTVLALIRDEPSAIAAKLKSTPMLSMLKIVEEDDTVNMDKIIGVLEETFNNLGEIVFDLKDFLPQLPKMFDIGSFTLDKEDFKRLKEYVEKRGVEDA